MTIPGQHVSVYTLLRDWSQATLDLTLMRKPNGLFPTNVATILPVGFAVRVGGLDVIPVDNATMVIDFLAGDLDTAEQIAGKFQAGVLYQLPGYMLPDRSAWVTDTSPIAGPSEAPFDSTSIGRITATYGITVRTYS